MGKAENLTGQIFGNLKVISRGKDKVHMSGQKHVVWICECLNCGKKKEIMAMDLKRGSTKSCGCLRYVRPKNIKICVECGKEFECPPSESTVTCSMKCRKIHAKKRQTGVRRSDETRKKISTAAQGRDMSEVQKLGTKAIQESPIFGRFETNRNALDWHLISPEGKHYYFHSLNFWLRENGRTLFGCEPDSKEYNNVRSGLSGAKRATLGGNYGCCTYKGWQVIPTDDDFKEKED